MNCPHCLKGPMEARRAGEVEIDRCPGCHAVFFDPGELSDHLGLHFSVEDTLQAAAAKWGEAMRDGRCPRCSGRLLLIRVKGGFVDVCEGCAALVLDFDGLTQARRRGRLEPAPLQRSAALLAAPHVGDAAIFVAETAAEVALEEPGLFFDLLGALVEGLGELISGW